MNMFRSALMAAAGAGLAACSADAPEPALAPDEPLAFVTEYACGDVKAEIGVADDAMTLRAGGKDYVLTPVETASGAKYAAAGEGPETSFWSKGENGLLVLEGAEFPECVKSAEISDDGQELTQTIYARPKWTARGQEPGWILTIENGKADFSYAYGEKSHVAELPPATAIDGGMEYVEGPGGLAVTVLDRPCADVMSGLPYPQTVTVALGEETFQGCGGDTESLLAGEWTVETIQGERLVDGSSVTMVFDPEADNVGGKGGCNTYGAPYTLSGEGITFDPPVSTEMACAEPLMTQERAFLTALAGIAMFSVDESGALLMDGHNGERITARR